MTTTTPMPDFQVYSGFSVCPGISIGPAHILDRRQIHIAHTRITPEQVARQLHVFRDALGTCLIDIETALETIDPQSEVSVVQELLHVHKMMLTDGSFVDAVETAISQQYKSAGWALEHVIMQYQRSLHLNANRFFLQRQEDYRTILNQLLMALPSSSIENTSFDKHKVDGAILICHRITPLDVIQLKDTEPKAIVTASGGPSSHSALLASTFDIPVVVGCSGVIADVAEGETIIVDGGRGQVMLSPSKERMADAAARQERYAFFRQDALNAIVQKPEEIQHQRIQLLANTESAYDLQHVPWAQNQSIGLFRTEYLYLNNDAPPSMEVQIEAYQQILSQIPPKESVCFRLFDFGSDKTPKFIKLAAENNPALGLRGPRFSWANFEMTVTQIDALLMMRDLKRVEIIVPMISDQHQMLQFRELIASRATHHGRDISGLRMGPMLELPSTLFDLERIAQQSDFVSIGTNDLVQYLLGIDRNNEALRTYYQPRHPVVLRALAHITSTLPPSQFDIRLCGTMAADPFTMPILIGLGYHQFSLPLGTIPRMRLLLRKIDLGECQNLASEVLQFQTQVQVDTYIQDYLEHTAPEFLEFFGN